MTIKYSGKTDEPGHSRPPRPVRQSCGRSGADLRLAVLIPCYNEEQTVGKVVDDFRTELPNADIYVYDNASSDRTTPEAIKHGAKVRYVPRRGKGAVVRYMFREIDADIYILVDGDDTYPARDVHELIRCVTDCTADMAVGNRHSAGVYASENKRPLHNAGNHFVRGLINALFGCRLQDILSGYRVFNRSFVKNCPILIDGFELEVMLTLHALDRMFNIAEIPISYRDRPAGSESKLNTVQDGWRIIRAIVWIFKDAKPLMFFLAVSVVISIIAGFVGIPAILKFLSSGQLHFLASIGVAATLFVIAAILLSCGLILDTEVKHVREQYELEFMRDQPTRGPNVDACT